MPHAATSPLREPCFLRASAACADSRGAQAVSVAVIEAEHLGIFSASLHDAL